MVLPVSLGIVWIEVFAGVLGAVRNDEVTESWAEGGLGALGLADGGPRLETAGGTMVLGKRVVPRGVSYRLALGQSLGAMVTLEPVSRQAVGLDVVAVTSVAVLYLPAVVARPVAVSHRQLVPSDLRDSMLGMDHNVGGKSGRGRC
jgi:hypothetical protein